MKHKIFFMLTILLVMVTAVTGQTVDTTGIADAPLFHDVSVDSMINTYNIIYGALVILVGYISKALGLKAKVNNFIFVIIAGGLVLAGAFIAFGFSKALPLAFTFLGSIGFYNVFLKKDSVLPTVLKPVGNLFKKTA